MIQQYVFHTSVSIKAYDQDFRIFLIYFGVFVLCVINPLLIDTQKNSLLFVFSFISWPKLFKNVSIIVLCKRHDSQSFLILCLGLRKTFISVIEMQTNS